MKIYCLNNKHLREFNYGYSPFREIVTAINCLLKDLSDRATPIDELTLVRLICQDGLRLYLLEVDRKIVGMGTLCVGPETLMKKEARIEDFVILEALRGRRLGMAFGQYLIKSAKEKKVTAIELTSRSCRVAANKLWERLGFQKIGAKVVSGREKNIYRLELN